MDEVTATACIKCGAPITNAAATGRQKIYCSTPCRRSAEHEIRRINALLAKLELQASHARLGYGSDPADRAKRLEAEIARQEARMRALLEGGTADE